MPPELSRRTVLRAAGVGLTAGLLAACTSDATPPPPGPPTADAQARTAAATLEDGLAELARRTSGRHPGLTLAAAAAAAHSAHAEALLETVPASASPSAPAAREVPASASAAARGLADAEQEAAAAHRSALAAEGVGGDVARLLASVAGSDEAFATGLRRTA